MLKKYQVDYNIWHDKVKKNVHAIVDNYKVKLATPSIPVFAWKPMLFVIGALVMWSRRVVMTSVIFQLSFQKGRDIQIAAQGRVGRLKICVTDV